MKLSEASILFVDDEPGIRDIFEKWLLQAGCAAVHTCVDGEEALTALATTHFDLIVSDIRMPRLDGIDLVRRRSQIASHIPCVIFISGFGDVVLREMYALGVEAFLPKPTRREEFFRTIRRSLADRSELWTTRPSTPPRQLLSDHSQSTRLASQDLQIGRGGYSLISPKPVAPGSLHFDLTLGPSLPRLKGDGHVRWRSHSGLLGIEFEWLDPSCHRAVVDHIASTRPISYIPDPFFSSTDSPSLDKPHPRNTPTTDRSPRSALLRHSVCVGENLEVPT